MVQEILNADSTEYPSERGYKKVCGLCALRACPGTALSSKSVAGFICDMSPATFLGNIMTDTCVGSRLAASCL